MNPLREIMRMPPSAGPALQDRARRGEPAAVKEFVLFSAWRRISQDKAIPTRKKPRAFIALARAVNIEVETIGQR